MADRFYVPGDEVVLSVVVAHLQNLEEIRVTYGRDGSLTNTITFIGELDSTEEVGTDETMEEWPLRAAPPRFPGSGARRR